MVSIILYAFKRQYKGFNFLLLALPNFSSHSNVLPISEPSSVLIPSILHYLLSYSGMVSIVFTWNFKFYIAFYIFIITSIDWVVISVKDRAEKLLEDMILSTGVKTFYWEQVINIDWSCD